MLNFLLGAALLAADRSRHLPTHQPTMPQSTAEVEFLSARVDALELACAGLWQLLKLKTGLTDEELIREIHEVDARDGEADGKLKRRAKECLNCGRKLLTKKQDVCLWCGARIVRHPLQ